MNPTSFFTHAHGKNARHAFNSAREVTMEMQGQVDLATKHTFSMILLPEGDAAASFGARLLESHDSRCSQLNGPCGCVYVGKGEYLFFGRC